MIARRTALCILAATAFGLSTAALASGPEAFTIDVFAEAQSAGKPILIDISATWCPTCKAQEPIIRDLTSRAPYSAFVVLKVDFDDQRDIVREFGARSQSTLIVYNGSKEMARSVGSTDPAEIEALLAAALDAH